MASFDVGTGRLIEGDSAHQVSSSGRFTGGVLITRDIPVHNIDQIVSTYRVTSRLSSPPLIRSEQSETVRSTIAGRAYQTSGHSGGKCGE